MNVMGYHPVNSVNSIVPPGANPQPTVAILAFGKALPPYGVAQTDIGEWMAQSLGKKSATSRLLHSLHANAGIDWRPMRSLPMAPPPVSWGSRRRMKSISSNWMLFMLPPLCGDGMAMALRSAELCAPLADAFLREELSLEGWGTYYQQVWQAEFERRVRTGRLLQQMLAVPLLTEAMVGVGRLAPPLATYFVNATRGAMPKQFDTNTMAQAKLISVQYHWAAPPAIEQGIDRGYRWIVWLTLLLCYHVLTRALYLPCTPTCILPYSDCCFSCYRKGQREICGSTGTEGVADKSSKKAALVDRIDWVTLPGSWLASP